MKFYCDGFNLGGNPSFYGGGYTICNERGELVKQETILKQGLTNNEAEIMGILATVKMATIGDIVSTDSNCCIFWCRKGKSKARPDLDGILIEIKKIILEKQILLIWEPREKNLAGLHNEMFPVRYEF